MKEMVEELKTQRATLDKFKDEYAVELETFNLGQRRRLDEIEHAKIRIIELTGDISDSALKEYADTGNKKLYGGIGIRVMSKLEYDEVYALQWAREHGLALKLDVRVFENYAKAKCLDFVKTVEVPKATIPMNL